MKYDLAIIGAGPTGLFAANYAQLHGLKVVIFESLNQIGGQPAMLYPFKNVLDIPVFNKITATELIKRLKSGIGSNTSFVLNHHVNEIIKKKDLFVIDSTYEVQSVIIATGNGAFAPKKFPLKFDNLIEKKIHYFVKDPTTFKDQTIGIFGGGDSALDWALELSKFANIKLIHRRNEFRGLETTVDKLKKLKNVQILTPYLPKTIEMIDNHLRIGLKETGKHDLITQDFDQIIVAYGFKADNKIVKNWGINMIGQRIEVNTSMNTNIAGIYAIGDAVTYPGRVPIIGVGFGEAQIAINSIMQQLFPNKKMTIHSTSM